MSVTKRPADCNACFVRVFQAYFIRADGTFIPCGNPHEMLEGAQWTALELSQVWPGAQFATVEVMAWRN
jgi:hypothetical protein